MFFFSGMININLVIYFFHFMTQNKYICTKTIKRNCEDREKSVISL